MIETTVITYLSGALDVPVRDSKPDPAPKRYVLAEKTGGGLAECIDSATIAIQSYAESMYQAALLNDQVKAVMEGLEALPGISEVRLNSDYNYTDQAKKQYRYQAVYDLVFFND